MKTIIRQMRPIDLRALGLALVMIFGLVTPALSMILPERIECGMECCLADGHCCCSARVAVARPECDDNDSREARQISRATMSQGCNQSCASSAVSAVRVPNNAERAPLISGLVDEQPLPPSTLSIHHFHFPASEPSSPRAPPRI